MILVYTYLDLGELNFSHIKFEVEDELVEYARENLSLCDDDIDSLLEGCTVKSPYADSVMYYVIGDVIV